MISLSDFKKRVQRVDGVRLETGVRKRGLTVRVTHTPLGQPLKGAYGIHLVSPLARDRSSPMCLTAGLTTAPALE